MQRLLPLWPSDWQDRKSLGELKKAENFKILGLFLKCIKNNATVRRFISRHQPAFQTNQQTACRV